MKQIEKNISGIFIIENEPEHEIRESPGGYFIEKSRKTELFRIKQKEEIAEQTNEKSFWNRIKTWLR